jgi:hypothetical protein
MPRKRKASKARVGNLQDARDALVSGKRRKSTPADSDISDKDEDSETEDLPVERNIVMRLYILFLFKAANDGTTSDGRQRQGG